MVQIHETLTRPFSRWIIWLWKQKGTPRQRALGVFAGVFSGCFPLFGFQTLLGIALAKLIRGNHLLAAAGTLISNPFTYLPLYWFNYEIGGLFLGQIESDAKFSETMFKDFIEQGWTFVIRLFLGSAIVGLLAAGVISLLSYCLFRFFSIRKRQNLV